MLSPTDNIGVLAALFGAVVVGEVVLFHDSDFGQRYPWVRRSGLTLTALLWLFVIYTLVGMGY